MGLVFKGVYGQDSIWKVKRDGSSCMKSSGSSAILAAVLLSLSSLSHSGTEIVSDTSVQFIDRADALAGGCLIKMSKPTTGLNCTGAAGAQWYSLACDGSVVGKVEAAGKWDMINLALVMGKNVGLGVTDQYTSLHGGYCYIYEVALDNTQ